MHPLGTILSDWLRTALQAGMVLCLVYLSGMLLIWTTDDRAPVETVAAPDVLTPEVKPGGVLRFMIHVRYVRRDCHGVVYRALIGPAVYDLPSRQVWMEGENRTDAVVPVRIPADILPGRYRLRAWGSYACNPLQALMPLRVQSPDVVFEVAP